MSHESLIPLDHPFRLHSLSDLKQLGSFLLPLSIIGSIAILLAPIPAWGLDYLLSANIGLSVLILLTVLYIKTPLEFSVFPSILLAATLFRLVLNIATTRLILTNAPEEGALAAGQVICTFSSFVTGNNLVVGFVIFLILILIQFIVITKGTTRISEVAARFTLDSMPGRQAAIDADLNAGLITRHEAQARRHAIEQRADFFGAMDGASKFVRGDAVAGVCITIVNIVGGFAIGISANMPVRDVAEVFTRLTIGDGLVSQLPALLISLAAGLLMTRSSEKTELPAEVTRQMFAYSGSVLVTGIFLILLIFTSLPTVPLLVLGLLCGVVSYMISSQTRQANQQAAIEAQQQRTIATEESAANPENALFVEPIEIELGTGIAFLAAESTSATAMEPPVVPTTSVVSSSTTSAATAETTVSGGEGSLLARIRQVRLETARQIGILLPKVSVHDNASDLEEQGYRIRFFGSAMASGMIYPQMIMAVDTGDAYGKLNGLSTTEPETGNLAWWISDSESEDAVQKGYQLRQPVEVISAHLLQIVRLHANELLTRDAAKMLCDQLHRTSPVVVDELIPKVMSLTQVQQILQRLLAQRVPIRQLGLILESLGENAQLPQMELTERVRVALGRTLCSPLADIDGKILVITLDPAVQTQLLDNSRVTDVGVEVHLSPLGLTSLCQRLAIEIENFRLLRRAPVLLTEPALRPIAQHLFGTRFPVLTILSCEEVPTRFTIESVGSVGCQSGE